MYFFFLQVRLRQASSSPEILRTLSAISLRENCMLFILKVIKFFSNYIWGLVYTV